MKSFPLKHVVQFLMALMAMGHAPGLKAQGRSIPANYQIAIAGMGLNAAIQERGTSALGDALAPDGLLVWPRVGILNGRTAATGFLRVQPDGMLVVQPLRIVVADDSTMGLEYGVAVWRIDSVRQRIGRYVAAWRKREAAWGLEAFLVSNLVDAREVTVLDSPTLESDSFLVANNAANVVRADSSFAKDLVTNGTAAYGRWAAPHAVTFGGIGELNTGPTAIVAALASLHAANWSTKVRNAGASTDQSVGWSAGELTVRQDAGQGSGQVTRAAYLTLWERQPDGEMRFIAQASVPLQ